jgi:glutathione S-transferase
MKLYYKPGACSLAVHIALTAVGAAFDLEEVDTRTQRTAKGDDFSKINPNGYVPALSLDSGEILVEAPSILQYIADRHPEADLAPPCGTMDRTRVQQQLNFTASELHKAFSPFFGSVPLKGEARDAALAKVVRRMDYVDGLLADGRSYLVGDKFSVADAYTFVVATWTEPTGIGLDRWPNVADYVARIKERPHVAEAMKAEGLIN